MIWNTNNRVVAVLRFPRLERLLPGEAPLRGLFSDVTGNVIGSINSVEALHARK